jgi:NAD(P)-dependent dehydrogenase (short-subunit alcohol dehydrogenase family)
VQLLLHFAFFLVYSRCFEARATSAWCWRRRGIGRATAVAPAAMGADVVVTGTGRDPATCPADEPRQGWRAVEGTAEHVRAHGRRALTWVGDISQAAAAQRLVGHTLQPFGRLDVLVHNAA